LPTVPITHSIELQSGADLLHARATARQLAGQLGLGVMDQTRFATAVSELCRNALTYARDGVCELQDLTDNDRIALQAVVTDQGPGIADIQQAMTDGFSSKGSLGAGLPGTQRLVDRFDIESSPAGTRVSIQMIRRRRMV
jgi:serine/threonine-protein kinase RsbT